jgi:hypothetical protein
MIDVTLVVLQNSENETSLCSEMSPEASQNAYQAISVKGEVPSDADAEAEDDPLAIIFPGGIKSEPEVSCASVSILG